LLPGPDPAPREPVLEPTHPSDSPPAGSVTFEDTEAEILLKDGTWEGCTVVAQRVSLSGQRQVEIRYYPSPSFGEGGGWYVLDRRYIRRLADEG
jgi:hypothetical protein